MIKKRLFMSEMLNKMSKNHSLLIKLSGSVLFLTSFTSSLPGKPLNIIYIMSDDHTQQMISTYDKRFGKTPNIDRLAEEGVKFTNSFVANSISGPSRACMLTGKHSHKNGFATNHDYFDGSQPTMPKILQANGYQTAMIGKWHLESEPTGFDYWEVLPGQGHYYQPEFITKEGLKTDTGYVTDLITDKSIAWLERRDEMKPFCLFVHHKATHRNWMSKLEDLHAYEDKTFPLPANFYDEYADRKAAQTAEMKIDRHMTCYYDLKVADPSGTSHPLDLWYNQGDTAGTYGRMLPNEKKIWNQFYDSVQVEFSKQNLSGTALVEWKYQRYLKDYLKSAKSLDDNIGRLLDYLEKEGLLENTIIVYTSDQGFYMGEHGWFDKRFMYEESLRTPLLIRLPKSFKMQGKTISQMVQNIDHAPTFLDIAGINITEDIQGVSYLPLLKGKCPTGWRKAIYYHYQEYPAEHAVKRHYGIRTERYKLIHFYNDIDYWELYDLKNDPTEMHNLINDPNYTSLRISLSKQLFTLQEKYDDPIRFKYP
ncbi:MAG: sulfatase [Paludibacter sp.]|nr:sulfatase [Paludibacter sp.]